MPLQDAARPSRKEILAEERRQDGAYDPVRLAHLLPPKPILQRRFRGSAHAHAIHSLLLDKRDEVSTSTTFADSADPQPGSPKLPSAPENSGAAQQASSSSVAKDDDAIPVPSSVPHIIYGDADATLSHAIPLASAGTTHNDSAPAPPTNRSYNITAADSSSGSGNTSADGGAQSMHNTVGIIAGLVIAAAFFAALALLVRRFRPQLISKSSQVKKREKHQRLRSIDRLRGRSSADVDTAAVAVDEQLSKNGKVVIDQVSQDKASPFDRDIDTMFSKQLKGGNTDQVGKADLLTLPYADGVSHRRSLDSIAEVQEPVSGSSTHFPPAKPDSIAAFLDATPKRITWNDRLSPTSASFHQQPASPTASISSSPNSKISKKTSPSRPRTAQNPDIEMTRQGTQLVIRPRSSAGSLRPSSAGGAFRSALFKRRREEETICIETDDIVDHSGEQEAKELRSKFSSSTLRTDYARQSSATVTSTVSPSGSFSFEIKDAIRLGAPLTLHPDPTVSLESGGEGIPQGSAVGVGRSDAGEGTFACDLDWDVRDCSIADIPTWTPPSIQEAAPTNDRAAM